MSQPSPTSRSREGMFWIIAAVFWAIAAIASYVASQFSVFTWAAITLMFACLAVGLVRRRSASGG